MALAQRQHLEAGAVASNGVGPGGEGLLYHTRGGAPDLVGPAPQTLRAPLHVLPVAQGHVLGEGGVPAPRPGAPAGGDAPAFVEDLHDVRGETHLNLGVQQPVRNRVVVTVHLDVIVEADAGLLPLGVLVGLGRQRLEGRLVEGEEARLPATLEPLEGAAIVDGEQLPEGLVQLRQRGEAPFPGRARIWRSTSCAPVSAFALSRGRRMRAGITAVPQCSASFW